MDLEFALRVDTRGVRAYGEFAQRINGNVRSPAMGNHVDFFHLRETGDEIQRFPQMIDGKLT